MSDPANTPPTHKPHTKARGCLSTLGRAGLRLAFALVLTRLVWLTACWVSTDSLHHREPSDLMARRAYLLERLAKPNAAIKAMPHALPPQFRGEWALVTYSMTAMALANLAFLHPKSLPSARAALAHILREVQTPALREFDRARWHGEDPLASLSNDKGHIGYLGHLNLILAAHQALQPKQTPSPLFISVSLALRKKLQAQPTLLAQTYPGETFLPDNCVVVASLALFARLNPQHDQGFAHRWRKHIYTRFRDPQTGLFVFRVTRAGDVVQHSRASGSAWNGFYLFYIDPSFAAAQFRRLKASFATRSLGLAGLREWPQGKEGAGDVDSGPLILGLSPAASGFAIAGARIARDTPFLNSLLWTAEIAGFSWQWKGKRQYLLAPLVGDAILLAMRTVTPWKLPPKKNLPPPSKF